MIDPVQNAELLSLLPRIRRARGFRLYAESGKRLLDLWQCGGAAALGHTPPRVLLAFKDAASRGLFAAVPSALGARFERALSALVSGRPVVRCYASEADADRALVAAGFPLLSAFADPAVDDLSAGCPASLWRPWLSHGEAASPVISPVLPLPHPGRPTALLLPRSLSAHFPLPAPASPVLLAAALRSLADLAAAPLPGSRDPGPRLSAAIRSDPSRGLRGPYIRFPECSDSAAYGVLFRRFLDGGVILPPDRSLPAILPAEMSPGEESALRSLLQDI